MIPYGWTVLLRCGQTLNSGFPKGLYGQHKIPNHLEINSLKLL